MRILDVFILSAIFQIIIFFISDKFQIKYLKLATILLLLVANCYFFPKYFTNELLEDEKYRVRCGLPQMSILFLFWIVGNLLLVVTSFVYRILKRIIASKA